MNFSQPGSRDLARHDLIVNGPIIYAMSLHHVYVVLESADPTRISPAQMRCGVTARG